MQMAMMFNYFDSVTADGWSQFLWMDGHWPS